MNSNAIGNQNVSRNQSDRSNTGKELSFHCSDVGPKNCGWQVSGNSEEELMPKIEQHGRQDHGMSIDDQTRNRVRSAIRHHAA
jgi:predicted small metal-binding protein